MKEDQKPLLFARVEALERGLEEVSRLATAVLQLEEYQGALASAITSLSEAVIYLKKRVEALEQQSGQTRRDG